MVKVTLTGFMGTGKTSVGQRLAERLGGTFVDTDTVVERAEGQTVERLFAERGEAYFRAAERCAVEEAVGTADAVIATGGGAIADEENFRRLHAAGPIVCLKASPEVILARVCDDGTARPLLAGADPAARVRELLARRAAAYAKADFTIDTSMIEIDTVVDRIVGFLVSWRRRERDIPEHSLS